MAEKTEAGWSEDERFELRLLRCLQMGNTDFMRATA
jgi:hypothetical protein